MSNFHIKFHENLSLENIADNLQMDMTKLINDSSPYVKAPNKELWNNNRSLNSLRASVYMMR
jgi:hypothetical protein